MTGEVHLDDGNMCKWQPVHRKTEESGHWMAAEKSLFPQLMVRAYDSPKLGGYLGNPGLAGEPLGRDARPRLQVAAIEWEPNDATGATP